MMLVEQQSQNWERYEGHHFWTSCPKICKLRLWNSYEHLIIVLASDDISLKYDRYASFWDDQKCIRHQDPILIQQIPQSIS